MDNLTWDPGEWKWKIISAQGILGKQIPFFLVLYNDGQRIAKEGFDCCANNLYILEIW